LRCSRSGFFRSPQFWIWNLGIGLILLLNLLRWLLRY